MLRRSLLSTPILLPALALARPAPADAVAAVTAAEQAFARSMAERDFDAFMGHIADDAVFINGGDPLHGPAAIAAVWRGYFRDPTPPFAWAPELVVVAGDDLAYSTGPVTGPDGGVILRFASTWRRERRGARRWKVVFDNGHAVCGKPVS